MLAHRVGERLKQFGIKTTIVAKNIGYELRCADPIPFDMEYTRDLGCCAATFLLDNGHGAMVSIDNGRFFPIPFQDILDPATGRTRVRMVDVASDSYHVARQYMIRLSKDDFEDPKEVRKYAATTGISPDEFRAEFEGAT
jgi:6-phosphofructokinase 1